MKKLLLIAILMLALVFTIVACDKTPDTTDTTVADTTAETPTEAPSEEATTETPTEETPSEEETTEAPTEETPTEAPTTAKPEDPTEPPTEEVTTADPADPVWIADPDAIAGVKGTNTTAYIADAVVMEEGGYKFVRITVNGGDSQFVVAKNLGTMPKYLAISYRANADKDGEMFIGTANGPNGQNDHNALAWNKDNSWTLMIVDVSTLANVVDGNVGYFRLDPFRDVTDGYIDIEYIAFFNTAEYALAYDFELHPPYIEADSADAGKKSHSFDTFYVNGTMYFPQDGGAGDKLTAQNNTLTFGAGDAHDSLGLRGWIGFNQAIDQFGYFIDNYSMVYGEYKQATEDGVLAAGGEFASRFQINVPLSELSAGTHMIGFVVKLEDGTVVRLRENLTVIIVPFTVDEEIILAARAGGTTPVVAPGQTMGQKYTVNGYLKQISVADMATYSDGNTNTWNVKIWAWNTDYATTVAGEPLYSVDGENHSDNQTFNVLVPIEKMITGDIYYEVSYLSGSGGFTGWNAQGKAVDGLETYIGGVFSDVHFASSVIVGVEGDPNEIKMDSHSFQSNAAGNFAEGATADVDLLNSDLANLFAVTYGQGDANHCYVKNNNGAYYWMSAFNSIRTTANGAYVFALDSVYTDNPGFASMIVRANMTANPEGQLYGADGGDAAGASHGGSGIYVTMDGNNLVINIKSYADGAYASNKFSAAVDSHDIKIADDGNTVYVLAGDKLVATIAISGTKDYSIKNVAPDALAETVVITMADGTTQTVENAVVASRNNNGALGVATRGGGTITFSALSLMPFDSIEIPGVETPDEPETPAIPTYTFWNTAEGLQVVKHQSFDQLFKGNGNPDDATNGGLNLFTPGASGNWDKTATVDAELDYLTYWGWIGYMGEFGTFGYQIDGEEAVFDTAFAHTTGADVVGAAQGIGATSGQRMKIAIKVAGLTGEHTVNVLYKTPDGTTVALCTFTLVKP